MKRIIITTIFLVLLPVIRCAPQIKNIEELKNTFSDIEQLLKQDNGKTWGIQLYGPLFFVDPTTKYCIANEPDEKNTFTKEGNCFTGRLSEKVIIANTAQNIDGKNWTMVMLPLPADIDLRRELIVHELFHNIQKRLNLQPDAGTNGHLDNKSARIYMRLEWNALLKAELENSPVKRREYIKDALLFRNLRRNEYQGTDVKENCLELQEGLAEYTGVKLGIEKESKRKEFIKKKVENAVNSFPSFIRSFAYISGPLYGLLLDDSGSKWRNELNEKSDLGALLAAKYKIKLNKNFKKLFDKAKNGYGFDKIEEFENQRDEKNRKLTKTYEDKFVNNPVLILPNVKMQFQFNPNELVALGSTGDVYPRLQVIAAWGTLTVKEGAVITPGWTRVLVTAPFKTDGNKLTGSGWEIKLNDGWKAVKKDGSFILENK